MHRREIDNIAKHLEKRAKFDYNYHNRIDADASGLYSFWLRGCCLYVGKSTTLRNRIKSHRYDETNDELGEYMRAFSNEIEVSYINLTNNDPVLKQLEEATIRTMRPLTNKTFVS